jgi:hypothetical protein
MGEAQGCLFEITFNRAIKVRQGDSRITSNAGAVPVREMDQRLGLTTDLAAEIVDPRDPSQSRYTTVELLRQHIYAHAFGHTHQDDQDILAHDAAMKLAVWDRPGKRVVDERLASQPTDSRQMERLATIPGNREALRRALSEWVSRHQRASGNGRTVTHGTIDIDPFPIEVHGQQEGAAYNGHYGKKIYYPLVASFSAEGSYEADRLGEGFVHAMLRGGNVGGAKGMTRFVRTAIHTCRSLATHLDVRIDAGLTEGRVLDAIDDEGVRFVGRIKRNPRLDALAAPFLKRRPGRPTKDGDEFAIDLGAYQAASWSRPYRIILVIIDLPDAAGQRPLIPHSFFLVTNWRADQRMPWTLLRHYRRRGTFEDRFSEFNACVGGRLSQQTFAANETSLLLKLLAFNLAGIARGELELATENGWDLTRVQRTVLRAGARVVKHSGRLIINVAEAAGRFWQRIMARVDRWWRDPAWGTRPPRSRRWVPPPTHAHLTLVLRE